MEFALIVPILLVLLVALADFGRIFAAGVVVEAATRDAAEVVAQEYDRNPPGDPALTPAVRLSSPAPNPGSPSYYDDLSLKAARTVCVETRSLPNTTYDSVTGDCSNWPVIRVCIHDGVSNNGCGQPITPGFEASTPSECDQIPSPGDLSWDPAMKGGTEPSRYVEVRVCYPFTTILDLPIMPTRLDIQRTRIFTIACFQDPTVNGGSC